MNQNHYLKNRDRGVGMGGGGGLWNRHKNSKCISFLWIKNATPLNKADRKAITLKNTHHLSYESETLEGYHIKNSLKTIFPMNQKHYP